MARFGFGTKQIVPKGCSVRSIKLNRAKRTAEVRADCGVGFSNDYRSFHLRGVTSVDHRGISVSGDASMGFTISPAYPECGRSGTTIYCKMKGDTSGAAGRGTLAGISSRRRRRSRR